MENFYLIIDNIAVILFIPIGTVFYFFHTFPLGGQRACSTKTQLLAES